MISDTHGLLRPAALTALEGVDMILHAGDVGKAYILDELAAIAPVHAVRGNVDRGPVVGRLPLTYESSFLGHGIYMLHILADLSADIDLSPCRLLIYGHSHRPEIRWADQLCYLNPGSAGPRRFSLPVTLARVQITPQSIHPELISLL